MWEVQLGHHSEASSPLTRQTVGLLPGDVETMLGYEQITY